MKIFFGTDLTLDKNNDRMDGEDFIVERLPEWQETALENSAAVLDGLQAKAKLPPPLRILYYVCGFAAIILFVSIFRALTEVPLQQAYANAPVLFWIVPVTAAVWGALALVARQRKQKIEQSDEAKTALQKSEALMKECYETLGVPKGAADMDVLCSQYRVKDGKIVNKPVANYTFINTELKVFLQDEALCFADINQKFAIPKDALLSIRTVNKAISLPTWNKQKHFGEAPYDKYKLSANRYGYSSKPYYALCIRTELGVDYELYFPCYELPIIQKLTGLSPVQ